MRILFWLWMAGTAGATALVFWRAGRILWQEHQDAKALARTKALYAELID